MTRSAASAVAQPLLRTRRRCARSGVGERIRTRGARPRPQPETAPAETRQPPSPLHNPQPRLSRALAPEAKQPTLVAAPMPVARPRDLVMPEPRAPAQVAALPAASDLPAGRMMPAPLPPARPAAIEQFATAPASVQSAGAQATADAPALPAGKLVAILHPVPPLRRLAWRRLSHRPCLRRGRRPRAGIGSAGRRAANDRARRKRPGWA